MMADLKWIQPGYVVELHPNIWLVQAGVNHTTAVELKKATRWPTERSAKRALSRTRKASMKKLATAKIYGTDLDNRK
jgi:hypothetical protein